METSTKLFSEGKRMTGSQSEEKEKEEYEMDDMSLKGIESFMELV